MSGGEPKVPATGIPVFCPNAQFEVQPRENSMESVKSGVVPRVGVIASAFLPALLLAAATASAGVGGSIVPTFPEGPVRIGDSFPATLVITNDSDSGNASESIHVSSISLTPSCGGFGATCPAQGADPNVFQVSPTATGQPKSACAGVKFDVSVVNAATGELVFNSERRWTLGPTDHSAGPVACEIQFGVTVLKMPAKDSESGAGTQTNSLARATFANGANPAQRGAAAGSSTTTVTPN